MPTLVECLGILGSDLNLSKAEQDWLASTAGKQAKVDDLEFLTNQIAEIDNQKKIISEQLAEVYHAEKGGKKPAAAGPKKVAVEQKTKEQVRLRGVEKAGVEAKKKPTAKIKKELTPKQEKDWLLSEIDKAIVAATPKSTGMITFQVPGATEYKILNKKETLEDFRGKMAKEFPGSLRKAKPSKLQSIEQIHRPSQTKRYKKILGKEPKNLKPKELQKIIETIGDTGYLKREKDIPTTWVSRTEFLNWLLGEDISDAVKAEIKRYVIEEQPQYQIGDASYKAIADLSIPTKTAQSISGIIKRKYKIANPTDADIRDFLNDALTDKTIRYPIIKNTLGGILEERVALEKRNAAKTIPKTIQEQELQNAFGPDAKPLEAKTANEKTLKRIVGALGYNIKFVESNVGANGVVLPSDNTTFYINRKADRPLMAVAGHEISHLIERNAPDLYKFLSETLDKRLHSFEDWLYEYNKRRAEKGFPAVSEEQARKELYGDFIGDSLLNGRTWNAMLNENPTLTARLVEIIKMVLDKITRAVKRHAPSYKYFRDIETLQKVVGRVLAEAAERQVGTKIIKTKDGIAFQLKQPGAVWYSQMEETLNDKLPKTSTPSNMKKMINAWSQKFFKEEELEWSGLNEWLDEQKGKITKQQILDYLTENNVGVGEVVKGKDTEYVWYLEYKDGTGRVGSPFNNRIDAEDALRDTGLAEKLQIQKEPIEQTQKTKFSQHRIPGGENYRELLLTLPVKDKTNAEFAQEMFGKTWSELTGKEIDQIIQRSADIGASGQEKFTDGHYDEPNVIVYIRFDERIDANGNRTLHIAEIQSDWMSDIRKKGILKTFDAWLKTRGKADQDRYKNGDEETVKYLKERYNQYRQNANFTPDAPFKKSYYLLAMKRIVRWAAENGFDAVTWDKGDVHFKRWGSERIAWKAKKPPYVIFINGKKEYRANEEEAKVWVNQLRFDNPKAKISYKPDKINSWLVKAKEQVGGDVAHEGQQIDIEGMADAEGLNVNTAETVTTQGELRKLIDQIAKRNKDQYSEANYEAMVDARTNKTWDRMQKEDVGVSFPRKESFENIYDEMIPNLTNKFFNKKAWGKARVGTMNIETDEATYKVEHRGGADLPFQLTLRDSTNIIESFKTAEEAWAKAEKLGKMEVWSLPITDEMRFKSAHEGMPLFQIQQSLNTNLDNTEQVFEADPDVVVKGGHGWGYIKPSTKKMGLIRRVTGLPRWIAKKWPNIKQLTDEAILSMKRKQSAIHTSVEAMKSYFSLKGDAWNTLRKISLYADIEGSKGKDIFAAAGPAFKVGENNILTVPERYEGIKKIITDLGYSEKIAQAYADQRKELDNIWVRLDEFFTESGVETSEIQKFRNNVRKLHNYIPHKRYGSKAVLITDPTQKTQEGKPYKTKGTAEGVIKRKGLDKTHKATKDSEGNWVVKAKPDMENLIYYEAIPSMAGVTLKGSTKDITAKAVKWAHEHGHPEVTEENVKFTKRAKLPDQVFFNLDLQAMSQIIEQGIKRSEKESDTEIREQLKNSIMNSVAEEVSLRGFGQHTIFRKNTPGYETQDLKRVMLDYIVGANGMIEKAKLARKLGSIMNQRDKNGNLIFNAKADPEQYTYASNYVRDVLTNKDHVDTIVDNIRGALFAKYLGLVIKTATLNLTQNMVAAWPRLTVWDYNLKEGEKPTQVRWAGAELIRAMKDTKRALIDFRQKGFSLIKDNMSDEQKIEAEREQQFLEKLIISGVNQDQLLSELRGNTRMQNPVLNKIMGTMGLPMQMAEIYNRTSTALAAYRIAMKKLHHLPKDEQRKAAEIHAENVVLDSHYLYGKINYPEAIRGSAAAKMLRPLYTFRTFTHNYGEMINWLMRQGWVGQKAALKSIGSLGALGGLMALPFYDSWDDAYKKLFGETPVTHARKNIDSQLMRDLVSYGALGAMGVDLHGSLGIELPKHFTDILGVPWAVIEDSARFGADLKMRDYIRAIEDSPVTPMFVRNAMSGYRQYEKGTFTRTGRPIGDLMGGTKEPRRLNFKDFILKSIFGFQPLAASKAYEAYKELGAKQKEVDDVRMRLAKKYVEAKREGDRKEMRNIKQWLLEWNEKAKADGKRYLVIDLSKSVDAREKSRKPPVKFRVKLEH